MEQNYLLTYIRQGFSCFEWFEKFEDMDDFIVDVCMKHDYKVLEKIFVKDAETLV